MGWVSEKLDKVTGVISDAVHGAVNAVTGFIDGIGSAVSGVVNEVNKIVFNLIDDPLPTLLQIGGSMVGIPPYVTAAAITAYRGGSLEDVAKSAAISYATTSFLSDTQIGADIKNYTVNAAAGDFTDAMMETFNLPADQAVQIAKVATASLNSSLVGGINAVLTGKPIGEAITSGFTSGLVYASTDSYFSAINKNPNWGFSEKAMTLIKGATSTALNTIISGKGDPSQALGNYIAYATINMGGTALFQSAKDAYKLLTTDTDAAMAAQDKYLTAKADYDGKVTQGEALRNSINADAAAYKKVIEDEYTPFKTQYEKYSTDNQKAVNEFNTQKKLFEDNKWAYLNYEDKLKADGWESRYDENINYYFPWNPNGGTVPSQQSFADAANAAAAAANVAAENSKTIEKDAKDLYEKNKPMLDSLETGNKSIAKNIADLAVIKSDIENVNTVGSTAATLKAAADAYQTKYDVWAGTKTAADRSAENYTKALAEVAVRDATIDSLNTGAITVTSKDANGDWTLSNGMTVTTQGKFMQDGVQVFTNAAGVPQKVMDFTANDGSKVEFNDDAGRVLSTSDVQNICKRDYGFTPTEAEAEKLSGATFTSTGNADIIELADQRAKEVYFGVTGQQPTAAALAVIRGSNDLVASAQDVAINGLDLPSDYKFPSQDFKVSFGKAYAAARLAYGANAIFEWINPTTGVAQKYTTENAQEQSTRVDKMLADAQSRINMMPASALTGAGRGFLNINTPTQIASIMHGSRNVGSNTGFLTTFNVQELLSMMPIDSSIGSGRGIFGGAPANVDNLYYNKKDGNVYVDTRVYDALGRVTSGSVKLADDIPATSIRATNWIEQAMATGAQGVGELVQNFTNAAALYTGSNMNNAAYNVGKAIEQWGKDRDGSEILKQDAKLESVIRLASLYSNPFHQLIIISAGVKENPLSFIASVGKEVIQEGPGWIAAAVAGVFMAPLGLGVGATLTVKAAISASLDALESMGSGGREVYDSLRANGVPENVAREKAMINGGIHALMTAPAEFVADRLLFGHFVKGLNTGVVSYAAKFGSTIATNALSETLEAIPQNLSSQYLSTGKIDLKSATAGALYEGMIGGGTVSSIAGAKSINDAAVVAKDYAGNNVTLRELMDGSKIANLSTLDSSASIGTSQTGGSITLGTLSAVAENSGISTEQLQTFLPASVTNSNTVVYMSADGTQITLGNIDSIVSKNPTLDFNTVLNDVYTTTAADFKTVFNTSVLNGSSILLAATDYETKATNAGFPSYAIYQQYGGDVTLYQNTLNTNLATGAGFPDYATYIQYNGDSGAYKTAVAAAANKQIALNAGFPDYATYTQYNGNITAYNTVNTNAANTAAAIKAGFPDFATYTQYKGNITDYNTAKTNTANTEKAVAAGFPDFATYTQYGGDKTKYTTALTAATNLKTATDAGFPDYATYTKFSGNKTAYEADKAAIAAGFPSKTVSDSFKGNIAAYNAAVADSKTALSIAAKTLPLDLRYDVNKDGKVTAADSALIQKGTLLRTDITATGAKSLATLDAEAKAAGFPDSATSTQYNGNLAAYTAAQTTAATTAANLKKATDAGFPDFATYTQYGGDKAKYTTALTTAANLKTATDAGFPDFATYTQYGGDKTKYTAALTAATNLKKATDAGFPDFATYTQYSGDKAKYTAAITNAENIRRATDAGFPDYATFQQYNGDIAKYSAAKLFETNKQTALAAGFPDFATYTQYGGDKTKYIAAVSAAANLKTATDAGFPDFATYTQYGGDKAKYTTALTTATNLKTATDAGFPDFATYTQYGGDKAKYTTALTAATNLKTATDAGFLDFATYTQYGGDKTKYTADVTAKTLGFADAVEQATAKTAGFTDATAYKNYVLDTANTTKAKAAGFPDYATYTQYGGDKTKYDASLVTAAITEAINNAIAGIKFPVGVSATEIAAQIKAAMEANPGLKATDITAALTAYMTANPGVTAADVTKAVTDATKDFATKTDVANAIAGIKFPAGITAEQVSAQIMAALVAHPGLSAADVTAAISAYMTAHPGLTAADVNTAINAATEGLVTSSALTTAISGLSADLKTKYDALTQAQKDAVAGQVQQGIDLNKAITDTASGLQTQITGLSTDLKTKYDALTQAQKDAVADQVQQGVDLNKAITDATTTLQTQITGLSTDLQTKYDALTQAQKTAVANQVQQGVNLNTAINTAVATTTKAITDVKTDLTKNITDVQTQFNTRVDELVSQGETFQAATDLALRELGTGVTGLQTSLTDLKTQQTLDAKAAKEQQARSSNTASTAQNLASALSMIAPAAALMDDSIPGYKNVGYKTAGDAKFESILSPFEKMVEENSYAGKQAQQPEQQTQQQLQQAAPVNQDLAPEKDSQNGSDYFNYGIQSEIDQTLGGDPGAKMKAGGLATPLFAGGGTTRHGRYAGGGLNVVQHSGKARLDFRTGNAVTGPGDGQSDDIPAMLADGEFVFPADVVAALGNGSTKAGSDKLYDMMHSIRSYHRSAKPEDLPPEAKKSPLDYLTKTARKARR